MKHLLQAVLAAAMVTILTAFPGVCSADSGKSLILYCFQSILFICSDKYNSRSAVPVVHIH